ncbi:N-acetylglucosamine repressor [mine drainage metagenome]|uniref:N-acetylglucosamine repressor n=1 Tax=mine drainage metagenome TaxID=410659 RepID=A0A1J5R6B0_9ZZZZ
MILAHLGAYGPVSRAELARLLGVTPPLITQLIRQLIQDGLVRELDLVPSQGGRPSRMLGLVSTAGHAIGVKIAAEHAAFVEVSIDGVVVRSVNAPFDCTSAMAVANLTELLRNFIESGETRLLGVGVGVPGTIDEQGIGVVNSTQLDWNGVALGSTLRRALNLPVLIENNVNALAMAERLFGQGRFFRDFLIVTIGTGVGAGIVADGKVFRGHAGGAGDLGHVPIDEAGPVCQCGNRGCLEAYIGEKALVRIAQEQGLIKKTEGISSLAAKADAGDQAAQSVFSEAGRILGRALAGVVNVLDPEIVIILGEGVDAWRHWSSGFEPALRSSLVPSKREVAIGVETWRDDSWARGAACLVLATPFDEDGVAGDQGEQVRARLRAAANPLKS